MDPMADVTESEVQQRQPRRDLRREYERVRSASLPDPAYPAERARLLLGSYRRDLVPDPDTYVQAITMVLSEYPAAVIEYATDPRTGLQGPQHFPSWPPNSGEVREFCDDEMRRIARMSQPIRGRRLISYEPPPNHPGCWAKCFIGEDTPLYARAMQWTQIQDARAWKMGDLNDRKGVWITYDGSLEIERDERVAREWQTPGPEALAESLKRMMAAPRNSEFGE